MYSFALSFEYQTVKAPAKIDKTFLWVFKELYRILDLGADWNCPSHIKWSKSSRKNWGGGDPNILFVYLLLHIISFKIRILFFYLFIFPLEFFGICAPSAIENPESTTDKSFFPYHFRLCYVRRRNRRESIRTPENILTHIGLDNPVDNHSNHASSQAWYDSFRRAPTRQRPHRDRRPSRQGRRWPR